MATAYEEWLEEYRVGLRAPKTYPVVRLTEDGPDFDGVPEAGDEIGYCMDPWRGDDCFQAAIATAAQIPIQEVPDLALKKQLREGGDPEEISRAAWTRIAEFAYERGLRLVFHKRVPVARLSWIGVIVVPGGRSYVAGPSGLILAGDAGFRNHCLVMRHDQLVFDPACSVQSPPGYAVESYDPTQITYGISFNKRRS